MQPGALRKKRRNIREATKKNRDEIDLSVEFYLANERSQADVPQKQWITLLITRERPRASAVQYCCRANCPLAKQVNAFKFSPLEWMTRKRHA
jgi:hypothetical protein